jgi:sulfur-carrier protein adenylyltransferase/sulfurtransferase
MPEAAHGQSDPLATFQHAQALVSARLTALGGEVHVLGAKELTSYPNRGFAAGWRLPVRFSDGTRHIELLLPIGFPWQPPRVALVDRLPFLTWPHIERDGVLCLAPNTLEIDPDDPAGTATSMLGAGANLVEMLIRGDYHAEFRNEFLSYWDFAADASGPALISLLQPSPPTRVVRVWRGKSFYLFAESDGELEHWLANRFGTKPDGFKTDAAAFLWIGTPPVPDDYPSTGQSLRNFASKAGSDGSAILSELARACPEKIVTVLGFETTNGPALAGVVMPAPAAPKHGARHPLTKGFRPGAVPDALLLARYFGGAKLLRRPLERADASWVHGRGKDRRFARLRGKRVAVIGCGSVGAPVAIALAQAGVGHLVLIDFDRLQWSNVGRHPLGASHVGQNKAKALAEKIRSEFPHITVEFLDADVDTVVRRHPATLDACDTILSATGSWAADGRLDAWHAARAQRMPVVYAWTEAHACAGHAVLVTPERSCLRCGFDNTGLPHFRITAWPNGTPERQEPACGAVYQPYGPVELGFVNSLVAELALDALLGEEAGPAHRVWVGPGCRLRQLGGTWSAEWKSDDSFREEGSFILRKGWASPSCARCAITRAT